MTSPKSVVALWLFASISIVACKKDNAPSSKGDALFVEINGGYRAPVSAADPQKKLQITANGSYEIAYTGKKTEIRQLPGNIHDSLKSYLSSFPRATVKTDPQVNKYSSGGALDNVFTTFTYIQEGSADTARIDIDFDTYVPYMEDYQKKIAQTIKNCHLLGY